MVNLVIYGLAISFLVVSVIKDREKTKKALNMSIRIFIKMLPSLLAIVGLIGIILGTIPPTVIAKYLGPEYGLLGTLIGAILGAITLIPSLVAFPLVGSLIESGASIMTAGAFITTLTMVGFVTLPLEIEEFGKKFAFLRNGLSFIMALIIALGLGVILG